MEEVWKDIDGFEGLYQVSNYGRIKSLPRNTTRGVILKPHKNTQGYLQVHLYKDGKGKDYTIHRLVALYFIPNNDLFKTQINHKDENKENNNVDNLEWCDAVYNTNYGNRNKKISKEVNQYSLDGVLIKTWKSTREIERELGYYCSAISECCNGKRKTVYGFRWEYSENEQE